MVSHVIAPRSVANFASDADQVALVFVFVAATGDVIEPGVVTFQTTNRRIAREISIAVTIK